MALPYEGGGNLPQIPHPGSTVVMASLWLTGIVRVFRCDCRSPSPIVTLCSGLNIAKMKRNSHFTISVIDSWSTRSDNLVPFFLFKYGMLGFTSHNNVTKKYCKQTSIRKN